MGLKEDIRTVSWMKNRAAEMLDQVNKTRHPVVIVQNGTPRAVIMDVESYERDKNALLMLAILARGEADVRAGRTMTLDEAVTRMEKKLRRRRRKSA